MTRRPRFNGSPDDHARTEQWLSHLQTSPEDGTTVQFTGASIIGLPVDVTAIAIQAGPAPLASYQGAPPSFPAPPPAIEHRPEPRDILAAVPVTEPAVIGDELRLPVTWCEMPGCINWFHHPDSAGFADASSRAMDAGWTEDAFGRLACPDCQQTRADYRTPQPVSMQHPGVPRRWHEHGTLPSAETQDRLEADAAYARRVRREHPDWARAMAGAAQRTAAS